MTVKVGESGPIVLTGICPIEDAEVVLRLLSGDADAAVDWSGCEQAHTAVIQVLMAIRPRFVGLPPDMPLARHIAAAIGGA